MTHTDTNQQLEMFSPVVTFTPKEVAGAMRFARLIHKITLAGVIVKTGSAIKRGIVAVAEHHARARAIADLRMMNDFELADIGLSRGDIASVVAGNDPLADRRAQAQRLADAARKAAAQTVQTDDAKAHSLAA